MVLIRQWLSCCFIGFLLCLFLCGFVYAAPGVPPQDTSPEEVSVVQLVRQSRDRVAANDLVGALQFARTAVAADPAYGDAWKQLGRIQMLQGKYGEAFSSLKMAYDLKKHDEELYLWMVRAEVGSMLAAGRFDEATGVLEKVLKANPRKEEIRQMLAGIYADRAAQEKGPEGAELLAKVVSLAPERGGAWRDLGWLYFSQGKFEEAVEAWNRALQDRDLNRKALVEQTVGALAEQRQLALAKASYQRWQPDSSFLALGLRLIELNRLVAAGEILKMAWDSGEDRTISGFYLAYTESRTGACQKVYEHLQPYSEKAAHDMDQKSLEVYTATLHTCSFESELLPLIMKLEPVLERSPQVRVKVVDIYEKAGNERRALRDYEKAYELFRLVLKYDPDRVGAWPVLRELAKNTNREGEVEVLLKTVRAMSSSIAVREGIEGLFAEERGDLKGAVSHYKKSLGVVPHQPELRYLLFQDLIAIGALREAEEEAKWFRDQVNAGNATVKSYLANILGTLGRTEEALAIWQELFLTTPENQYYATETARAMFALCRAEEAIPILEQTIATSPGVRAFELLAEIESALGRPQRAFEVSTSGLAFHSSPTLHRIRAEAADILGEASEAEESSRSLLKVDSGNVSMNLILGRALSDQKLRDESIDHYKKLLARNPAFMPSLVQLRNLHSSANEPDKALFYASELARQRPWDAHTGQFLSLSQVEADDFTSGLKYLRGLAEEDPDKATAILLYRNVLGCPYKGRNTVSQFETHVKRLAAEGYRFVWPDDIGKADTRKAVVIFVTDTEPSVVRRLDEVLKRTGGRAVYGGDFDGLKTALPGGPSPDTLREMRAGGRWTIASSGPSNPRPVVTSGAGTIGNALTHRIYAAGRYEDYGAMEERLDNLLNAQDKLTGPLTVLVYPQGDYGQMSLDTDVQSLNVLSSAVRKHFQYAVAGDEKGFVVPGFEPTRMPGRYVPAEWGPDDVAKHLRQNNPYVRARLELAKVLYLYSQHERANVWFRKAEELGASPEETNFFWGSNAHIEGDLPIALEKLRKANRMNPGSERNLSALRRSEHKKAVFVDAYLHGWTDSDDRSYSSLGAYASAYVTDYLMLETFGDRTRWSRSGMGHEYGNRFGAGTRWHFKEEYWLDARLWHMNIPGVHDYLGGSAKAHIPNEPWGGYVNLWGGRQEVDTVEAVRKKIMETSFGAQTYSRIRDEWDLYADLTYTNYTDNNNSIMLDGIFMKRLHEWPFLGAGYRFRFGDSSKDPIEYWSPQSLQQHEFYAATRGEYGRFHYTASGEAGFANDDTSGWRFVWGGRLDLAFMITPDFSLRGRFSHRETPSYRRNEWIFGASYRF